MRGGAALLGTRAGFGRPLFSSVPKLAALVADVSVIEQPHRCAALLSRRWLL